MALLDLLVGNDDERDEFVFCPANVIESPQGIKTGQQAGLHITGTRTNEFVVIRPDRA